MSPSSSSSATLLLAGVDPEAPPLRCLMKLSLRPMLEKLSPPTLPGVNGPAAGGPADRGLGGGTDICNVKTWKKICIVKLYLIYLYIL